MGEQQIGLYSVVQVDFMFPRAKEGLRYQREK